MIFKLLQRSSCLTIMPGLFNSYFDIITVHGF